MICSCGQEFETRPGLLSHLRANPDHYNETIGPSISEMYADIRKKMEIPPELIERMADENAPRIVSEHMTSVPIERKPKTWVYSIISNRGAVRLGLVKWYAQWSQYNFFPEEGTTFNSGCLYSIFQFIRALMDERRKK